MPGLPSTPRPWSCPVPVAPPLLICPSAWGPENKALGLSSSWVTNSPIRLSCTEYHGHRHMNEHDPTAGTCLPHGFLPSPGCWSSPAWLSPAIPCSGTVCTPLPWWDPPHPSVILQGRQRKLLHHPGQYSHSQPWLHTPIAPSVPQCGSLPVTTAPLYLYSYLSLSKPRTKAFRIFRTSSAWKYTDGREPSELRGDLSLFLWALDPPSSLSSARSMTSSAPGLPWLWREGQQAGQCAFHHLLLPKSHLPSGSFHLPAALSLGKFRELRQKFMCKRLCSAMAEEDYKPSALACSPPLSSHRETFQGQQAGPPLCLPWVFRCSAPPFPGPLALLGSPHCCPWWSHLTDSHVLGFVLQEKIHQLVQVILTVNLEGLGSRGTRLAFLKDVTGGGEK